MPIPHLKRRIYGYTEGKNNSSNSQKNTENSAPEQSEQRPKKKFSKLRSFIKTTKNNQSRPPKKRKKGLFKKILVFLFACFIIMFVVGTIAIVWISRDLPNPDKLTERQMAQSTKIYDRTGQHLLYEVYSDQKRTLVELDQIPKTLVDSVIATEDKDFYNHKGIKIQSIIRSILVGIFTDKKIGSGASTLTQQLVKNAILTTEKTYTRKIKEIILTIRIEQKYSKQQILKIYFNEIPYGSSNYGIESASQSYFGKHVWELNLSEQIILAGFPQQPTVFLNNPEKLKTRYNIVLNSAYKEGYITKEEMEKIKAEPIMLKQKYASMTAPHFVLYVKEQLVNRYGEHAVDTGGLKVITTLDYDLQQKAENFIKEKGKEILDFAEADNTALLALDPKTGQVLTMIGSRDFNNNEIKGKYDIVRFAKRQPGSSIKPIIYTAAFEKGYTPDTVLYDVLTNFAVSGKEYMPTNYDLQEHGPLTMRQALQGSLNIPAVQTFYLVGEKKGVEFTERLGYTTFSKGDFGLSLVLGGGGVNMMEHVNAFATFANNGQKNDVVSILSVKDSNGETLEEWKKPKNEKVLEPEIAATISNVLSDDPARAYIFGANGVLTLPGRKLAVKTGTTNNYIDAWTVGYTPSLTVGVWAGNTDNTPMKKGFGGSMVAAKIWNAFMKEALEGKPVEDFPSPPPNTAEKPVLKGSSGGTITILVDKATGKIATSSTPEQYIVEKQFMQPHSILHYVDKDDPRGPVPEHPEDDPQYQIWENAIQAWINRKKEKDPNWLVSFEEPPTEYDDAHSLELIPSLEIIYPADNSTLNNRQIDTDIRVSAPRGVSKVTYKIDKAFVGVVTEHPFNLHYFAQTIEPGNHKLTIIVEDDVGNKIEGSINFNLDVEAAPPSVNWIDDEISLSTSDFPRTFLLKPNKLEQIKKINIYYSNEQNSDKKIISSINSFVNLVNNQISFEWKNDPGLGKWNLIAEVETKDDRVLESDKIVVEVK